MYFALYLLPKVVAVQHRTCCHGEDTLYNLTIISYQYSLSENSQFEDKHDYPEEMSTVSFIRRSRTNRKRKMSKESLRRCKKVD